MSIEKVEVVAYEVVGKDGTAMVLANNILMDDMSVQMLRDHREVNDLIRKSDVARLVEALRDMVTVAMPLDGLDQLALANARNELARWTK